MIQKMRRFKQELSQSQIEDILKNNTSGVLSVIDENGYPYSIPLSYIWTQDKIYFHSATSGHKINAIKNCNKATFCIIDKDDIHPENITTYYKSVIAFGKVSIVNNEKEKISSITLLGEKYCPNHRPYMLAEIEKYKSAFIMIRFDIESVTGKQAKELIKQ